MHLSCSRYVHGVSPAACHPADTDPTHTALGRRGTKKGNGKEQAAEVKVAEHASPDLAAASAPSQHPSHPATRHSASTNPGSLT